MQALGSTLGHGQGRGAARRASPTSIPAAQSPRSRSSSTRPNWPALLPRPADVVIDACDDVRAKAVLAAWARASGTPLVSVGAAGGKRAAERVEVADLADVTHDPMLAALRQRLRKHHGAPRAGALGVCCVFSREPVAMPASDGAATSTAASTATATARASP